MTYGLVAIGIIVIIDAAIAWLMWSNLEDLDDNRYGGLKENGE